MGVVYLALPLNQELAEAVEEYGAELGDVVPNSGVHATPSAVLVACKQLEGYDIQHGFEPSGWQLDIEHSSNEHRTLIHLNGAQKMDQSGQLVFEKGAPELILLILKQLAKQCGTYVLFPDDGTEPLVVHENINIDSSLGLWGRSSDEE